MGGTDSIAVALLQLGSLMAVVLLGNVVAARRLPVDSVPDFLMGRILLCNRMRPWLGAAALAMIVAGLVIQLG